MSTTPPPSEDVPFTVNPNPHIGVVNFAFNTFSGSIPSSYANPAFDFLALHSNQLAGNFTPLLASVGNQHLLSQLYLSDNDFFGTMQNMNTLRNLMTIDASNTLISLCDQDPKFGSSVTTCAAANMPNGGSCPCRQYYQACDSIAASCTTGQYEQRNETSYPTCGTTHIDLPKFSSCSPSTMPAPNYVCVNGTWAYPGTVTETINVNSPTFVYGNLTVATITISNPSGSIVVTGCINAQTVEITLTHEQLTELEKNPSKHLLTQLGSNCPTSLSTIAISPSISGKSCKRITATSDPKQSDSSNLVVMFKVNSDRCRVWWIVLASVLGGIILIVAILAVLSVACKPFRAKIAPFWARNQTKV